MAVLAPSDWTYPHRDSAMDLPSNPRQRSSPANDHSASPSPASLHQQQMQSMHSPPQQPLQQPAYTYPVQQQPQGSWTPSIAAAPFYPSFYQNHQQQQSPQAYPSPIPQQPPYFDPANAQLAQWAYQQMMFNAQHGFPPMAPPHHSPPQRSGSNPPGSNDYFSQNQIPSPFNSFPSGTPPPHTHRGGATDHQQQGQQNGQYSGFHPYRRPNNRQTSQHTPDGNDWRSGAAHVPHPPYARPEASGSSSSVNSTNSQRQRTNSNQSAHSGHNVPSPNSSVRNRANGSPGVSAPTSARSSPASTSSSTSTSNSSPLRMPHHRNGSSSSSASAASSTRPSPLSPSVATTSTSPAATSASSAASSSTNPRPSRPSPLSQGNFTASEKRMSRDDSDLAAMLDPTPSASMLRSGGLKGRLRRALSFNAAQALKEEETDDDESIKASALNGASSSKLKAKAPPAIDSSVGKVGAAGIQSPDSAIDDAASTATVQIKKKGRAASLFNSRLNASTDNISLSSTVSSASVMIRKLGSMGKLARRNSLAGITSLFKDKDKDKDKDGEAKDKKGKKKDKEKKSAKGEASVASVSHVTAELDRSSSGDWNVGGDMNGLSPAAKLARQHTLKSNAEAAAKAKAQQEAQAAVAAAGVSTVNGSGVNGAGVPTWDRNTATRQGSVSPVKGGGVRVNEDGTRVFVEDDDDESDDGHYGTQQAGQSFHTDGWDDDEDWDVDVEADAEEDLTIRVGMERSSLDDGAHHEENEAWAVDVRRSVERTRKPAKGILKYAGSYDQQTYIAEQPNPNRVRSNSYNSHPSHSELGPLARMPSPDPDHIDGLHRHGSHSSHGQNQDTVVPSIPPLAFESSSPLAMSPTSPKELPDTPTQTTHSHGASGPQPPEKGSIFQHPNLNSSAPVLSSITSSAPTMTHRSATSPSKRLAFASNLSVYDTFSASVYDRRSEPATWSRLTPALAQRIKEELNSYKMEEMEVHAASRIHTQFFV
ncbi:hypothetical protein BDQ12DRAFT_722968 [Crucibulum laeve]|uniref:Uncharacterized protein n=1 Tax=Crucibulum laeve TaxID=68775 RepID=A0A5C3MBW6_9AGAR|nr:hypothetical protein BDQ12DRAFT_722968 [Crucibulum laeve]